MRVMEYKAEHTAGFGKFWTVFIPVGKGVENLPQNVREELGQLYPEAELDVESDRFLSDAQKRQILDAIHKQGFYAEEVTIKFASPASLADDDDVELEI